ncbi:hypothetical protein [uncultured Pseudacidovorax sp.]|uniref:hypothetical protein n=1 Tax=uncultured Pseudacidovorax sp. TaxID=679313 RepID=UPI0025CD0931|nr:hypothetical protein [uncultured Pseudacidovorax sp.]
MKFKALSPAYHAQWEAALCPRCTAERRTDLMVMQPVARLQMSLRIKEASLRLPARPQSWIRLASHGSAQTIVMHESMRVFLADTLSMCVMDAAGRLDLIVDPRCKEILKVTVAMLRPPRSIEAFYAGIIKDAEAGVALLRDWLVTLRKALMRSTFLEREKAYHRAQKAGLARQVAEMRLLASSHPGAGVVRFEIYRKGDVAESIFAGHSVRRTAEQFKTWLAAFKKAQGKALLKVLSCAQWGDGPEEWGHHILAVLAASSREGRMEVERTAEKLWMDVVGSGGSFVSCKGRDVDYRYRGRRDDLEGGSLRTELMDAAVYFAHANSIIAPVAAKPVRQASGVSTGESSGGEHRRHWANTSLQLSPTYHRALAF